jgi:hypothetical protein
MPNAWIDHMKATRGQGLTMDEKVHSYYAKQGKQSPPKKATRGRASGPRGKRRGQQGGYWYDNGCPAVNPEDTNLKLGLNDEVGQKEVLRHYLKTTNQGKTPGTFGAVQKGTAKPNEHAAWPAAKAYYESGCVVGPNCAPLKSKVMCSTIVDPRGFLCRWNQTSNVCEARPDKYINMDGF